MDIAKVLCLLPRSGLSLGWDEKQEKKNIRNIYPCQEMLLAGLKSPLSLTGKKNMLFFIY